ncbi:DUF2264 domain-containing protein [Eisenbergiella sp.]
MPDKIWNSQKDFQELLLSIVEPLKPFYSEERAGLVLGATATNYDRKAENMEAFSRPLWGLVPFWAGGGTEPELEEIYRRGLTAGTDPRGSEFWGGFHAFDQKFVEMAAISYGLILTPEKLWDPLSDREKERLADWLYGINQYELPVCNWILFAVLVNVALMKLGRKYDAKKLEKYLQGVDEFYLGDGWYQDGDSGQKDYYVSFAIHFYCLFYARSMGEEDPERCQIYKERAMLFGKTFIYWFDEDGAALPFGRSLTYRFAQVSFWSACLMAGVYPYPVEVMKGLIVRHMQDWLKKPVFDRDHILTIGYAYPDLVMGERYNGPGSPYWSLKTFAFLMLPDDHSFWSAKPAPLPALEKVKLIPYADMLMAVYEGHNTAYVPGRYSPAGHGQSQAKYGKFAYDTRFGFHVARSCFELHEAAPDSMLAFCINGYTYVRRICEDFTVSEDKVVSSWSPYPDIQVETTVIPERWGHRRIHRIVSSIECEAYDCGFGIASDPADGYEAGTEEGGAWAKNRYASCEVTGEYTDDAGEWLLEPGVVIDADPNTNLLYPKAVIPAVKYRITEGVTMIETCVRAEWKRLDYWEDKKLV